MKLLNSIGKAFSSFFSWVKAFLADADGEASSKRLSMLFLVACLGFGFVASAKKNDSSSTSETL